jgi:hypothetical protein
MFCDSGTLDTAGTVDVKGVLIDQGAVGLVDQHQSHAVDGQRYPQHDVHYHAIPVSSVLDRGA